MLALLLVTDAVFKGWQKLVLNSELMDQQWDHPLTGYTSAGLVI